MRFSLRQLEVFVSIAQDENVSKAASKLSMSQSACSSALKDLESLYDSPLFERVGKRLLLNDYGRTLYPMAKALLDQAAELELSFRQHKNASQLKLGATLTVGNYLAVDLIAQFMARYQGNAKLTVANTHDIAEAVLGFNLDLGLIEGEIQHPLLDVLPWRNDQLICFCAPNHPLSSKPVVTDQDLVTHPWILRETGSGTRQTFDRAMHGLLTKLPVLMELQHTEAIKQAVKSGLGMGCLSRICLESEFADGSLKPLAVNHRDFSRTFYLVIHKQKYRTLAINQWLRLCEQFK